MKTLLIAAASAALSAAASAGVIHVSPIGGGIDLTSGPAPAFGPGPGWSQGSLAALHASINGNGIGTDNKITFAAVDSDHGLAMVALIDLATGSSGQSVNAGIHMDGVSDGTSLSFSSDALFISPPSSTSRFATGDFAWDSTDAGAGFGWGALHQGTAMTWRFQKSGPFTLDDPSTFQFVNWDGSAWHLVPLDSSQLTFSASGEFGFSANVTLVPAPGVLGLCGVGGLGLLLARRRR